MDEPQIKTGTGTKIDIHEARFGCGDVNDVDISSYLHNHRYKLYKTDDLITLFTDPYPNVGKQVYAHFTIRQEHIVHTVYPHAPSAHHSQHGRGCRLGYVTGEKKNACSYHLAYPKLYSYELIEATFQVDRVVVRPPAKSISCWTSQEVAPNLVFPHVLHVTNDGYVHVLDHIDVPTICPEIGHYHDATEIDIVYTRSATYRVVVHERGGSLLKDVDFTVELPMYRTIMAYHLFPRFHHSLMPIHWHYLRRCIRQFEWVLISVANEIPTEQHANEHMIRTQLEFPSNVIIRHTVNSASRGESSSFMNLLTHIKEEYPYTDYVFYAHSKGMTHRDTVTIRNVACWVELMYNACLTNLDTVVTNDAVFGGNLVKKDEEMIGGNPLPRWHYSGSYYWMHRDILSKRPPISLYNYDYYITERFPGLMCPNQERCITILDYGHGQRNKSMYDSRCVRTFRKEIETYAYHSLCRRVM